MDTHQSRGSGETALSAPCWGADQGYIFPEFTVNTPQEPTPSTKEAFTPWPKEANSHQTLGEIFSSIPCILTVSSQHEHYL